MPDLHSLSQSYGITGQYKVTAWVCRVQCPTWHTIGVILEISLSRQSIAMVLTTKHKETQHCTHPKRNKHKNLPELTQNTMPRFGTPFTTSSHETRWTLLLPPRSPSGVAVENYTSWWQRHMYKKTCSELFYVVEWSVSNLGSLDRKS